MSRLPLRRDPDQQGSQIDEVDFSAELLGKGMADSHGNGGLPDTAWTKKGDEPFLSKARLNVAENRVAPDHPARARGEDALVLTVWNIRLAVAAEPDQRADKRIAPALDVRDVPVSEFAVAKRFSDRGNVDAKVSFLDDYIRPGVINELFLCYDLARTLDEIYQNIERTPTNGKHEPVAPKGSLAAQKLKWAKTQISFQTVSHMSAKIRDLPARPYFLLRDLERFEYNSEGRSRRTAWADSR